MRKEVLSDDGNVSMFYNLKNIYFENQCQKTAWGCVLRNWQHFVTKYPALGRLWSQMPHTHAWSESHLVERQRGQRGSIRSHGLSEISLQPSQNSALTRGPYVRILSENQIDGLHTGRERKAITYSELYFFSRLDQCSSYCKTEKTKVKF